MKALPSVQELISTLTHKDGVERERARHAIEVIGEPAVPFLLEALTNRTERLRWEACKALVTIKSPTASTALVGALEDESMEVRWLAAEALIALSRAALPPLLHALEDRPESLFLRQGAHHVLHALEKDHLLLLHTLEVLDTIRTLEAGHAIPVAARRALNALMKE